MSKFKKINVCIMAMLLLSVAFMFSCGKSPDNFVTFMVDGVEYKKVEYLNADTAIYPVAPYKKGYTFSGWYYEQTLNTPFKLGDYMQKAQRESITVYGTFTKSDIVLRLDAQGGEAMDDVIANGSISELKTPKRDGYNFCGWYYEDRYLTRVTLPLSITESKTIYSKWKNIGEDGLVFEYKDGGFLLKSYTGKGGAVELPGVYDNTPVIEIGDGAFENTKITSITIPSNVAIVGEHVFSGCIELSRVDFASDSKLSVISGSMFYGCGIQTITLPTSITAINQFAFSGCEQLTSIVIPKNVVKIEMKAFNGCEKLASIVIPKNVVKIEMQAFNGCAALLTATFESPANWFVSGKRPTVPKELITSLADTTQNAKFLNSTYVAREWTKE